MHVFIDTATGNVWEFDDDVTNVCGADGIYHFMAPNGELVNVPSSLRPYVKPGLTILEAQADKVTEMEAAYAVASTSDVTFTSAGGMTKAFQSDEKSHSNVKNMLEAYRVTGVPTGFFWKSTDNTRVPFTYADLQGLAQAMGNQGWPAFLHLSDRKDQIAAIAALPPWAAGAIALNAEIRDAAGNIWQCTAAGTSGATEPAWPTSPAAGAAVTDGAATWTFVDTQIAAIKAIVW